jgi:hypothetical protein
MIASETGSSYKRQVGNPPTRPSSETTGIDVERDLGFLPAKESCRFGSWVIPQKAIGCVPFPPTNHDAKKVAQGINAALVPVDVQALAGHSSLSTTAQYIEADADVQRKVVALI